MSEEDDDTTPPSVEVASLLAGEIDRYRNCASEEAIAEACAELSPHSPDRDDGAMLQVLRRLWVRGVDWGSRWDSHIRAGERREVEVAQRRLRMMEQVIEDLRRRVRLLREIKLDRDRRS